MPHLKKIVGKSVRTIVAVRYHRISLFFVITEIKIYHWKATVSIKKIKIFPAKPSHNNDSINSIIRYKLRQYLILLRLRADRLHDRKALSCNGSPCYLLIHLKIKGIIFIKIALPDKHSKRVAPVLRLPRLLRRRHITHAVGKLLYLLSERIAVSLLSRKSLRDRDGTHSQPCSDVRKTH